MTWNGENPYHTPPRGGGYVWGSDTAQSSAYGAAPGSGEPRGWRAGRWSPAWALAVTTVLLIGAVAGAAWGVTMMLEYAPQISGDPWMGVGVVIGGGALALAVPTILFGILFFVTRARLMFYTTLLTSLTAGGILLWAQTW